MYDTFKNLIVSVTSVLIGYFAPLKDIVFVIFFIFLLNCLFGLLAGVGVEALESCIIWLLKAIIRFSYSSLLSLGKDT